MDGVAERTDMRSGATGPRQQLRSAKWCSLGMRIKEEDHPDTPVADLQ
jgi:hypothetical protein